MDGNKSVHLTKAAEHGTKALSDITDVFNKLAGPLAEELGKLFGDKVREYRLRNLTKIMKQTQRMLNRARIEAQPIPPRLFLPAVEAASAEDDETLQERWAALLANASDTKCRSAILPSFVGILRDLTPDEAKFLQKIYERLTDPLFAQRHPMGQVFSSEKGQLIGTFKALSSMEAVGEPTLRNLPQDYTALMVDDLVRFGILNRPSISKSIDPGFTGQILPDSSLYLLTAFGHAFLKACEPPTPQNPA